MHSARVCGDAGVHKPTVLPAVGKCGTYNYVQDVQLCTILDNGSGQLRHGLRSYNAKALIVILKCSPTYKNRG